jgi:autotransporter-associated beta strand protein
VVAGVVTCSGALPDGVAVSPGPYQGLSLSNVAGDMAATNRPVIAYRTDEPNTAIVLNDPDSVVRLSTAAGPTDPNLVGAIQAILPQNVSFSFNSNLDIVINEQAGGTVRIQPAGIIVAGQGGTFDIANSGDIAMTNVDFAPDNAFILVDVFGAELVTVRNSGDLSQVNSDVSSGIIVAADNRRVEIANEGDIVNPEGFSGIAIEYQIARFSAPIGGVREVVPYTGVGGGLSYHPAPARALESYSIRNSGLVATEFFGIRVNTDIVDQTGNGIGDLGAPDGTIVNDGTIRSTFGISVRHYGDRGVLNNGRIENIDDDEFFGISVGPGNDPPEYVPATVRIENGATGVIEYDGTFLSWGIQHRDNPAAIVNAGRIALTGGEFNRGVEVSGFGERLGLTTIENSGTIQAGGAGSEGVLTAFTADPTGAFSDTRLVNGGLIEAAGADSRALVFGHFDNSANPGGAQRGRVSLDLAATSVVRGGSGADGAAIVFNGGESHGIVNRGLITAASGRAIVGGAAAETLDNSGRIEGSVALAAGNDAVTMRGGSVSIGTLDGGAGTDSLLFDIATGEAFATGPIVNFESVSKTGAGTLTLRDTGTIAPGFSFVAGTLIAEGSLGSTAIAAPDGTRLGGSGSVGAVNIADGATIAPGLEGVAGTLSVASLDLSSGSVLRYDLALAGTAGGPNDLITVAGALRLDGRVDVNALPGYGPGVYRLINYGGALTDNGLVVGTAPAGDYQVQTAVAGQVNLVFALAGPGPTPPIQFWDGADTAPDGTIDGGSGNWGGTRTNWTRANGDVNEAWNGNFAVFQGTAGTVTVDPAGVSVTGLQFAVTGYRIEGGPLTLAAPATIRVGDGSAGSSSMTATIASPIGGTSGLSKTDLGTLVLTGANSYTGGTTVAGGVLQVSADNALGAASGGLTLDGGALRAGASFSSARALTAGPGGGTIDTQANSLTLSGPVGGTAGITKTGSGTLVLTGSSGAYGGRLTLGAGALRLDGTLGGTLEVGAGTTLSGTGSAGNLVVAGTLAPGNSGVGTMSATGNATFRTGSTFAVELTSAGANDRLNVAGTATIEGGTVAVTALDSELNYTDGASYTFLSAAGGRTGTFAAVSENSAFLDFSLAYTPTGAALVVDVIRTFPEVAQTFNQTQAATGLRGLDRSAGSDSLAVYNAILLLDEAPARGAFDASSGEIYAATMASSLRQGEMAAARLTARAYEGRDEGLGLWGGVDGHDGEVEGDGNGATFAFDGVGANLGIDYRGRNWAVGVGGGRSDGDVGLADRGSRAETETWHVGAFGSAGSGHSGFSAAATGVRTSGDADVARSIAFGTISRTASSRVGVDTTALSLDLRYGVPAGRWAFGPVLGVAYSEVDLESFTETGANSLGLSSQGSSDDWASYAAGAFASLRSESGSLTASVQYFHGGDRAVEADLALAGAPSAPFRVRAAVGGEDAALLRLSGRFRLGGGWSVGGNLRAVTGSGERSVAGAASIGLVF